MIKLKDPSLFEEIKGDADTLAGLISKQLGHLPKRGESVMIDRFLFKIMSADSRRIKHVQVVLLPSSNRDDHDQQAV